MIERRAVLVTATIGAAIAAIAPSDRLFVEATLGLPLVAAALMALLTWLCGSGRGLGGAVCA